MSAHRTSARRAAVVAALALAACHGKQELTAPPPPLRPEPLAVPPKPAALVQKDCDPTDPARELKPLRFDERSIPEAEAIAQSGREAVRDAHSAEKSKLERESSITAAVELFITALQKDPYNVAATYGLAGTYALIDRPQCSINLLARLLQLRSHASKRADVEKHLDRLLGRKVSLDPDFAETRKDERFRKLIQKMCEGTNDANCVYGGQRENRER